MAVGATITDTRYNNLQDRIAEILGTGSGTSGYGQSVSSTQVANFQTILASHMNNLYTDMVNARAHQTGTVPTAIAQLSVGNVVGENSSDAPNATAKGYADFESLMTTIETDKFLVAATETSIAAGTTSVRTSSWNTTIVHEITVTFTSETARRHFFNAGGEIRTRALLESYSGSKSSDWFTMLSNMGTIKMNYTQTTATGTGSGSSIGFYDLTSSYQTIFTKSGSGVYAENDYIVEARLGTVSSTTEIDVKITFRDDDAGDPDIDESVNGTLTSTLEFSRPSGSYVSLPAPSASNITTLQ